MAYCENCGSFIPESAKFCENCGSSVINETIKADNNQFNEDYSQPDNYQNPQQTDFQQQSYYQQPYQQSFQRPKSSVTFKEAITMFFKRYVDFSGRSVKSEFWYVFLFNLIIGGVLGFLSYTGSGAFVQKASRHRQKWILYSDFINSHCRRDYSYSLVYTRQHS